MTRPSKRILLHPSTSTPNVTSRHQAPPSSPTSSLDPYPCTHSTNAVTGGDLLDPGYAGCGYLEVSNSDNSVDRQYQHADLAYAQQARSFSS